MNYEERGMTDEQEISKFRSYKTFLQLFTSRTAVVLLFRFQAESKPRFYPQLWVCNGTLYTLLLRNKNKVFCPL